MLDKIKHKIIHAKIDGHKRRLQEGSVPAILVIPARLTLGKLYARAGDTPAAIQEFAIAALAFMDQGKIAKAMAVAQMIQKLDPQNTELYERLAELYVLGQTDLDPQLQAYQDSLKDMEALQRRPQKEAASAKDECDNEPAATPEITIDVVTALRAMPVFAKLSASELRGIQSHSNLRQFTPGQSILSNGNVRQSLFAILQGRVNIFHKEHHEGKIEIGTLHAGSFFGEFELFGKVDPNVSIGSESPCIILEIPRDILLKAAKNRPYMFEVLKDLYRRRILGIALSRLPLLHQLTQQDRQHIVTYFQALHVEKDTIILREGNQSDHLYFVATGEIGVYTALVFDEEETPSQEDRVLLATLKSGEFFGEKALVSDEPSSATLIALTDAVVFTLSRHDTEAIIQAHPVLESVLNIEAFQEERRKKLSQVKQLAEPAGA